jgi:molecular chaperone DnaK
MIMDSFYFAEEDFRQRLVAEARVEADNILMHLDRGRKTPAWQQLTSDERNRIDKMAAALEQVKAGDDFYAIRNGIEALNQGTMRLAELMMNTVTSTLKGKTMEQADMGDGPSAPHPFAPAEITTGEPEKK